VVWRGRELRIWVGGAAYTVLRRQEQACEETKLGSHDGIESLSHLLKTNAICDPGFSVFPDPAQVALEGIKHTH
jgi:hypothetical protein